MNLIRKPGLEDKDNLLELMKITWQSTYPDICQQEPKRLDRMFSEDLILSLFRDPAIHLFVVFDSKNKPIAYAKAKIEFPRSFLDKLYVLPEKQGKGIGKKLIAECFRAAMEKGMNTMALEVAHTNIKAISFYEHLGFRRKNHTRLYPTTGSTLSYGVTMICFDLRWQLDKNLSEDVSIPTINAQTRVC